MQRFQRTFFTLLILLFANNSFSQNQQRYDSLIQIIKETELKDSERLAVLYDLAAISPSIDEQLKFSLQLLEESKRFSDTEYIILGYQVTGVSYRLKGNLSKGFEYLFEGANIAIEYPQYELHLSNIYTELATCYTLYGDSKNALVYGEKSLEILRKKGVSIELGVALLNIGYDHYLLEAYQKTLDHYQEAEVIFEKTDLPIGKAYVTGNRALVYWKQGHTLKAIKGLEKAIDELVYLDDRYAVADYYNQLGNIHFEKNKYKKAEMFALKALAIANAEGLKEQIRDAYHLLSQIYTEKMAYDSAMKYQSLFHAYKDSIYNQNTADLLANLNSEFELTQKEAQVSLLLEQRRGNRIIIITGSIILFTVIIIALLIYKYYRSKSLLNLKLESQKNELITLNETKDKFFSIISHDLRGPVNVISGLTSVMKKDLDDFSSTEIKEMVEHTSNSAGHLVKLLDNLLHWALQQRGMLPYEPTQVNLKKVVNENLGLFEEMAKAKDISCSASFDDQLAVYADQNAVSTIFRNLINNAIKFSHEGGKINISARINKDYQCEIRIEDQGVGISEEKVKALFKQTDNYATYGTKGEKGMGLGLQLVQEFVAMNKGRLSIESILNEGTTVTLILPTSD